MNETNLSSSLIMLAQKILGRQEIDCLFLARELLLDVDRKAFQSTFDRYGCKDFKSLRLAIEGYYLAQRGERIKWDAPVVNNHGDDFIQIFAFILDLALKADKVDYIERILSLDEKYQIALHPFVQSITQRTEFVERAEQSQQHQNRQNILELEQENQKLRTQQQYWMRKYQDLKQSYDYLKISHDKLSDEVNFLKQDRYQLINELGGSDYGSIEETVQKVKKDITEYQKLIQKLHKDLEEKKTALKQREDEFRDFQTAFKTNRYEEKSRELDHAQIKIKQLESDLASAREKEECAKGQMEIYREGLKQKQLEMQTLNRKLAELQAVEIKFQQLRRLHARFKGKIIKDYREFKE